MAMLPRLASSASRWLAMATTPGTAPFRTFVEDLPTVFLPIAGGWGRMGMTHIRLAAATEEVRKRLQPMFEAKPHVKIVQPLSAKTLTNKRAAMAICCCRAGRFAATIRYN